MNTPVKFTLIAALCILLGIVGYWMAQTPTVESIVQKVRTDLENNIHPGKRLLNLPLDDPGNLRVLGAVYADVSARGWINEWLQSADKNISALTSLGGMEAKEFVKQLCRAEIHVLRKKLCPRLAQIQMGNSIWSNTFQLDYHLTYLELNPADSFFEQVIRSRQGPCADPKFSIMGPYVSSRYYTLKGDLDKARLCLAPYNRQGAEKWRVVQYLLESAMIDLLNGKPPGDLKLALETSPMKEFSKDHLIYSLESKTFLAMGKIFDNKTAEAESELRELLDQQKFKDLKKLSEGAEYFVNNLKKNEKEWPDPTHYRTWFARQVLKKYKESR